jgi:3-hydroxybutyryl-CoA dehydrogenase
MKWQDVKCVGIMGAGVMGGGIAQNAILCGTKVIIRDLTDEIIKKCENTIINGRFGIKGGLERGKHTQEQYDRAVSLLNLTTKAEDLADVDLLIEAIGGGDTGRLEDKPLKLKVFGQMDEIVKKDAIFASNTSTFSITDLAAATKRKDKFIGMHWFSPANIMKLVELIYTTDTNDETFTCLVDCCVQWEKVWVRVKDIPGTDSGFIGNRIMGAARREAMKIVQEGIASNQDVDKAMVHGFRWPVGPFMTTGEGRQTGGVRSGWQ